jgi:superfamily II DNA or RNA helicase
VRIKGGDYDAAALSAAVDQAGLVGDIVEHWQRRAEGRRTVVFAVDVEHSRHIVDRFKSAGIPAEHLDGATPTAERDAILARLESGETRVVSNCAVLCEGWDQPSCKCVVLARPTKSTGLYLQMAGRILRPWRDPSSSSSLGALILDHAGNVLEHGLPQDDREFSLDPPKKRQSSKGGPACKTCEQCYAIAPAAARVCPACGADFPVVETDKTEERDGELVEVRAATQDEKRVEFDRLMKVASERGYRGGWVYHRYREKFGVAPPAAWSSEAKKAIAERPYTLEEKREYLDRLNDQRRERGYAVEWVYKRFQAKFGEPVPGPWMLPSEMRRASESIDAVFGKAVSG